MIKLNLGTLPQNQLDGGSYIEKTACPDERWLDLWKGPLRVENEESVRNLAQKLKPHCKNLVVIGIGGSSLGLKAIHGALCGSNWNLLPQSKRDGPRLFILDTIDPTTISTTIEIVKLDDPDLQHTVDCVISKSGETIEIASNLMVALRELHDATFVAITGRVGSLREFAQEHDWDTLLVPDGVGGRFSVLSPVGLFPACMCGVNIEEMLDGAAAMSKICEKKSDNPAAQLASFLISHAVEQRPIQIMMPYDDGLTDLANWWVQLWAESLGKMNTKNQRVGPTPIAALGVRDQHSMLQLWREGPTDKVIGFVGVEHGRDIDLGDHPIAPDMDWLSTKTMRKVLNAEQEATTEAVTDADQPTWTLTLPKVDACSVGQFFALWEIATAIAGRMLGVNTYDQPGVELGKQLTITKLHSLPRG